MLTRTEQSILMQNRLFAGLSEAELSGLLEKMSAHTSVFAKKSVLWGMGEKVENAGIVLSGRVEAWQYTQDGQENLAVVHEAGGLFGDVLMSARTVGSPVELRAAKDSRILFFWTHCSAAAQRAVDGTVRSCCPICWRKYRKNTGRCRTIFACWRSQTGEGGWRPICSARRKARAEWSAPI